MKLVKKRKLMFEGACKALCRTWPKAPDGCAARCLDRLGSLPATGCKYATEVHGQRARAVIAAWDAIDADIGPPDKLPATRRPGVEIEIFTQHFGRRMPLVSVLHALAGQEGNDGDEGDAMQAAADVIQDFLDAAEAREEYQRCVDTPGSQVSLADLQEVVSKTCGRQSMNCQGAKKVRDLSERVNANFKKFYGDKRYTDIESEDEGC